MKPLPHFIFRDVFPNITKNILYCTNKLAAEGNEEQYANAHQWLTGNREAVDIPFKNTNGIHYNFYITNETKELEFIEKFGQFMAPIEVD